MWIRLRDRRLSGVTFRRQHVIAPFVADVYAASPGLAVEVDGEVHDAQEIEDRRRSLILAAHGVRVLRFAYRVGAC